MKVLNVIRRFDFRRCFASGVCSILFLSLPVCVFAEGKCYEPPVAINYAIQGLPEGEITGISLKVAAETNYMLFFGKDEILDTPSAVNWRLLERQGESLVYCLIGAGKNLETLVSLHEIPGFNKSFGLPGSGYRRCNDESDGPMGSVAVRAWANKELGDSVILSFGDPFVGKSLVLLWARESVAGQLPWVLVSDQESISCYYARGADFSLHEKFSLRDELKVSKSEFEELLQ